ncbi:MAG: peptidoglycan-binding protein [Bacteroidaceae bacterium]|nr:peptidoglycan-binding protein [Bacteroidaceae bacterium]
MVNNRCKYLLLVFAWLQPLFLFATGEGVSCDTMFVFKKMPADTVVVKKDAKKSVAKKKAATKKKAAKKVVKKPKVDSVKFAPVRYSLGDRVIMHGDSGADVKKLAEIMIKHLYMEESAVIYTKDGAVLYDGELVRAVKLFQKVSGLYEDGMVGETTIKALRKIHRWRRTSK